jgi:Carbohydrate esterase, sialic acid-specific acetylesterase
MAARPVALIALRFVPLLAKAGRAARQAARLGLLAGRARRQGQKTAKQWGENFKRMVTAWRADIGDPKLPVILLVLKPGTEQTLRKYPYRDVVRQQQSAAAVYHQDRDHRLRL